MNAHPKDLEILNTMTDEEWSADGMRVFDSEGVEVAETQDIEDARYIAHFSPNRVRELLERVDELEHKNRGMRRVVNAVSRIGVDLGYGKFALPDDVIGEARGLIK